MNRNLKSSFLICAAALTLLSSCAPDGNKPGAPTAKIAFVTNTAADFWTMARKGCEQADSELDGVEVEFRIAGNDDAETLAGIEDGSIRGTFVQHPYEFGYQAVKLIAAHLSSRESGHARTDRQPYAPAASRFDVAVGSAVGFRAILSGDRSEIPAARQRFVPKLVVRKDNVQEYSAKLAKLKGAD